MATEGPIPQPRWLSVSQAFAALAIPVVLALVGSWYTAALKEREIQGRFVELALAILQAPPDSATRNLRNWAIDVVNSYSGVPLGDSVSTDLRQVLPLPQVTSSAAGTVGLAQFAGKWENTDRETRGITSIHVIVGDGVRVHVWGKCHPTDCDWGEVPATPFGASVSSNVATATAVIIAVFRTTFSETTLSIRFLQPDGLRAESSTRFTDQSGRASYAATYDFHRID